MDWFSIAKIGASLLGAKAAGDAAKASAKSSQTDLKKLRDEAQAAGFNPLTVLRATGGQGFNKGANGKLASATFWGNFANAVPGMVNEFDPDVKRRKELDIQQAQASLGNTLASTQLMKSQMQPQKQSKYKQEDLFIEVVDPTGSIPNFIALNPDLLDSSINESTGAMAMYAAQFALQHQISVEEAKVILNNGIQNYKNNLALKTPLGTGPLDPIDTTTLQPPKLSNWDSYMDSIRRANVDRVSFFEKLTSGEIARQNREMMSR